MPDVHIAVASRPFDLLSAMVCFISMVSFPSFTIAGVPAADLGKGMLSGALIKMDGVVTNKFMLALVVTSDDR